MREKICPLGLIARGAYSCQGKNCAWTDKNDECLIKEILSELKDCLTLVCQGRYNTAFERFSVYFCLKMHIWE